MSTPRTPLRRRTAATAALVTAGLLALAGCSGSDEAGTADAPSTAESAAPGTDGSESWTTPSSSPDAEPDGDSPELEAVPASRFAMSGGDYYAFDFSTGGRPVGLCTFSGVGVTCTGTPDSSVPDLTQHFPGRPSAIGAQADGLRYTFIEGVPPAPGNLETGQQVSLGDVTCAKPAAATLDCTVGGSGFTISGDDRRISTRGTVLPEAGTEGTGGGTGDGSGGSARSADAGNSGQPLGYMGASGLVSGVRTGDGRLVTATLPTCDGRGILIHDSYVENRGEHPQQGVADLLDAHPGSRFAPPGQCPSLRGTLNGARVYPVYTDYGHDTAALCRAKAAQGGNARLLVNRAEFLDPC